MDILRLPNAQAFVATGYIQKADGSKLMRTCEQHGVTITCDWTKTSSLSRREMAIRDTNAVRAAQVLVALMTLPEYDYKGTFTEIGIALGAGIPIVLISPFQQPEDSKCAKNVYFHHSGIQRYLSMAEFLAALTA